MSDKNTTSNKENRGSDEDSPNQPPPSHHTAASIDRNPSALHPRTAGTAGREIFNVRFPELASSVPQQPITRSLYVRALTFRLSLRLGEAMRGIEQQDRENFGPRPAYDAEDILREVERRRFQMALATRIMEVAPAAPAPTTAPAVAAAASAPTTAPAVAVAGSAPTSAPATTATTSQPSIPGPALPLAPLRVRRSLRLSGADAEAVTEPMDLENDEEHVGHDDDDSPDEEWREDPADEESEEEEE